MNPISNLGLLATLLLPATSAAQSRVATLAQAQETFSVADANKDGKLSPEELAALQLQLTRDDTRGIDFDRDGFWSRDEFLLFYRQRLLAANVKPAADLEAEATRILAARKAKTTERGPRRNPSEGRALSEAVDELQAKASAGQAVGSDFDRVRDLLVADARANDQLAKGQDPLAGEHSELQSKLLQSIERLRAAAVAGQFSREEYQDLRAAIVKRARNAAGATEPNAQSQAIGQALAEALDRLEQRALAGNATREDFERVREQLIARARAAANGASAPGAVEQELQSPLHTQMIQTLDRLQAEEYLAFRESIVRRFRNLQNTGAQAQPPPAPAAQPAVVSAAADDAGMNQAADELEKRVNGGQVAPADFAKLRGLIAGRIQAATGKTDPSSVNELNLYQKLIQSLERLEKAAQSGAVDRQEFLAFKDSFIHRARQAASSSQPSSPSDSTTSAEPGSSAKRAGTPGAAPDGAQPLPTGKAGAQRTDPARDPNAKGGKDDPKPAPQSRPKSRRRSLSRRSSLRTAPAEPAAQRGSRNEGPRALARGPCVFRFLGARLRSSRQLPEQASRVFRPRRSPSRSCHPSPGSARAAGGLRRACNRGERVRAARAASRGAGSRVPTAG